MTRYAHRTVRATLPLLLLFLLLGCGRDAGPPQAGAHRPDSPNVLPSLAMVVPEGSLPIRFSSSPDPGGKAQYTVSEAPETLNFAPRAMPPIKALHQWYLTHYVLGPGRRDSVSLARERWATADGCIDATYVVIFHGLFTDIFSLLAESPSSGMLQVRRCDPRVVAIPAGRSLLVIRTDSASVKGTERFAIFGLTHRGGLMRYRGPTEYFRDGDIPEKLSDGQVLYAHIPMGWFSVPLPLTFEPAAHRFVAEVSDDGILPASGTAFFRGGATGSMLIRLTSSLGDDASALSVPMAPGTSVVARKAHVPWLTPVAVPGAPRTGSAVYVEAGLLAGWLADSLFDRFSSETTR